MFGLDALSLVGSIKAHLFDFCCSSISIVGLAEYSSSSISELNLDIWTASSELGTYSLCEQRRFRRACASAQSRQNLRCSLIQAVSQEEPSDRKPDPWPLWMAGHAQLIFVMTEILEDTNSLDGAHMFAALIHWWVRSPSRGPHNLYVYEPQQNTGRGLRSR